MIAPLRRRHRWLTASLALVVPVLYVVALAARPGEPVVEELPAPLAEAAGGQVEQDLGELFGDPAVAGRSRSDGYDWWLELTPAEPIAQPEVLVYWSRSEVEGGLPEEAYLLGGLAGDRTRTWRLPHEILGLSGTLVLYSLGHQEVVASASLPGIGSAPPPPTPEAEDVEALDVGPTAGEAATGEPTGAVP